MDEFYIIILYVVPTAMFLSGFIIARQLQALENVPFFSKAFVRYRLIHSMVMGFLIALPLTVFLSLGKEFSTLPILAFMALFLLAATGYYFGIKLGWRHSQSLAGNVAQGNQVEGSQSPENIVMEDTSASVKITINTQKRWGWFALTASQWVIMSLCIVPVAGLGTIAILQYFLAPTMNIIAGIFIGGLLLYLLRGGQAKRCYERVTMKLRKVVTWQKGFNRGVLKVNSATLAG